MVHDARDTVTEAGTTTIDTIKTNPIPAAMIAVGLGWLIVSGVRGGGARSRVDNRIQARSPRSRDQWYGYREGGPYEGIDEDGYAYRYRHEAADEEVGGPRRMVQRGRRVVAQRARGVAEGAQHAVADVANGVVEKAEHAAHDAGQIAQDAGRRAGMVARRAGTRGRQVVRRAGVQARRAEQRVERSLDESPLAFGAVAVAIGAAIGLLLPHTEMEDRLVGEQKDRLLDTARTRAEDAARHALSSVQERAGTITQSLKSGDSHGRSKGSEQGQGYQDGLPGQHQNGLSNGLSKHV